MGGGTDIEITINFKSLGLIPAVSNQLGVLCPVNQYGYIRANPWWKATNFNGNKKTTQAPQFFKTFL